MRCIATRVHAVLGQHCCSPQCAIPTVSQLSGHFILVTASRGALAQSTQPDDRILSTDSPPTPSPMRGTVQDALAQIDRLRDLLEESAAWGSADSGVQAGPASAAEGGAHAAAEGGSQVQVQQQRQLLLEERARCAGLELGMRALAAELTRAQHARWEEEGGRGEGWLRPTGRVLVRYLKI